MVSGAPIKLCVTLLQAGPLDHMTTSMTMVQRYATTTESRRGLEERLLDRQTDHPRQMRSGMGGQQAARQSHSPFSFLFWVVIPVLADMGDVEASTAVEEVDGAAAAALSVAAPAFSVVNALEVALT